ncbi:cation-translocating P-type ATPase [Ancylobacter sp. TS-1]|uniref:heavy metal translocating P-type ATPase n=1 Tax=Ancylobacter sp. TS-1 TaxID=1850374 RepID=UPI001265BCB0|nr:heavy metal translocating P-type ATPase [Ancylobacter sp. TS-1]QFR33459.1 cadmium-translocating P-type ATPase [Ancylobacter sp. TS-1]
MSLAYVAGAPPMEDPTPRSVCGFVESEGEAKRLHLLVAGAHCAACISAIEGRLRDDPAVTQARLNLALRRLSVEWRGEARHADALAGAVEALGYTVAPFDPAHLARLDTQTGRALVRALAIAAFASSNVMMLSLAVWAGQAQDMAPGTQLLFQWLAGLVALPAVAFAGRPFFRSALRALRAGRTNIDVPIALGLILTTAISVIELLRQGRDVYFDSATALLFVLLVGRYLDFRVRARSRGAIERLLMLKAHGAAVCRADGTVEVLPAEAVHAGMSVLVRPGERVPVDGFVIDGRSELDVAIVTGESLPQAVAPGARVLAGSVNRAAPLRIRASAGVEDSHLADVARLVERAEQARGPAQALADRVARIWTPIIHPVALATLLGWWLFAGAGLAPALLHAVSVLIIACPCAIGLAVPAVQVVATGALLRRGVLLRAGDALERLAGIDHVAFDKTGTLTCGQPRITRWPDDPEAVRLAAGLAAASHHPAARALHAAVPDAGPPAGWAEVPGEGLRAPVPGGELRLGRAAFCRAEPGEDGDSEIWLARPGRAPVRFGFEDALRPQAGAVVAAFRAAGLPVAILSGDRLAAVARVARVLGLPDWHAGLLPGDKLERLDAWRRQGWRVLMVGDGLNDAPALAGAHVSASFAHGAPASQSAADIVLPPGDLAAVHHAWRAGRRAHRIIVQNLVLAALYNVALIPVAIFGLVTPLGAAVAMAASSLTVTLNALRAGEPGGGRG